MLMYSYFKKFFCNHQLYIYIFNTFCNAQFLTFCPRRIVLVTSRLDKIPCFVNCIQGFDIHRSSSRSKFDSHVVFRVSWRTALSSNTTVVIRRFASLYAIPLQSMVINNQLGNARPVGSCQKFPWHGTRKNVRENGLLFQHRHFLHDKFLVNDEFLQIHECWHGHVIEKNEIDSDIS